MFFSSCYGNILHFAAPLPLYLSFDSELWVLYVLEHAVCFANAVLNADYVYKRHSVRKSGPPPPPSTHTPITGEQKRRRIVFLSFFLNLAILFFFKYFNFACITFVKLGEFLGVPIRLPAFEVILPVGISFYIFQALSYTMDVYRGEIPAEKNFLKYALFVSFFPQLVAGPIERSKNLLSQISERHTFLWVRVKSGLLLMLFGYFQKVVIADRLAILVNQIYNHYQAYEGFEIALATVFFAFQIYFDFASYSNIAVGASRVLGFRLMENFNTPYFSLSVSEFWRRWHISLSTWFRDYLYIPLGGNRKGKLRKYLNLMIVFLISGLWHGASWHYVAWGGLNGFFQVVEDWTKPLRDSVFRRFGVNRKCFSHKLLSGVFTFVLVDFAWLFFRSDGLITGLRMLRRMFLRFNPWIFFDGTLYTLGLEQKDFTVLAVSFAIILFFSICRYRGFHVGPALARQGLWFRWTFYFFAIFFVLIFGVYGPDTNESVFIYFQF